MSDSKSKVALLHFRQYYDELLIFLTRRLGSHEQALDATQETFLRVLSQKSSHPIDNPRAFLYKTARNLTIDMFRREQKHTHVSLESDDIQSALTVEPDQEQRVEGKERLHRLYLAIQELPPKCRHVFLLHKFQERSQMEIAIQLGISKNMVEKHVMKALAHCKRWLDDSSLVSASSRSTRTSLRRYESSIPRE
ncbi:MAG: RNA polymerase sigma factor [Nitrospirales bacterium]|nr:MAG: RNA polymerase sigma factor [Nitrospirales bacterium]